MNISTLPSANLELSPSQGKASSQAGKIHQAAQQFEAMMIGEMLKSVRESTSSNLSDDDPQDPGQDSLSGMAESTFANALAKSGGLGLTHMIEQGVSQQAGTPIESTAPTSNTSTK